MAHNDSPTPGGQQERRLQERRQSARRACSGPAPARARPPVIDMPPFAQAGLARLARLLSTLVFVALASLALPALAAQAQSGWRDGSGKPDQRGREPAYSDSTERVRPPATDRRHRQEPRQGHERRQGHEQRQGQDRRHWEEPRRGHGRPTHDLRHDHRHEHRHEQWRGESGRADRASPWNHPSHGRRPQPYPYSGPDRGERYYPPRPDAVYPSPLYIDSGEPDMDAPVLDTPPRPRRAPARMRPDNAGKAKAPPPPRRPPAPPASPAAPARADTGVPPAGENRFAPGEVLATLAIADERRARNLAMALARTQRLQLVSARPVALAGVLLVRYRIPDRRAVSAIITALERDARVLSAQPNYLFTLSELQTGGQGNLAAAQYGLAKLRAGVAHLTARGSGVLTAVIDSGVDARHRELAGSVVRQLDVTDAGPKTGKAPPHAHGTAVAGIIAAHDQMSGVAPAAHILALRAFAPGAATVSGQSGGSRSSGAQGSSLAVVLALDAAVQGGARVVNMSFAGPRDPLLAKALAAAAAKGVILVAAAGNDGPEAPAAWPAADPHVIAVTATGANDQRIPVASRGAHIAVAAPGADIIGPAPGDSYQFSTGSSMAAAQVSGVVALLLEANPALDGAEIRKILMDTAKDLGPAGKDADTGAGLVDAAAAVSMAKKAVTPGAPNAAPASGGTDAPGNAAKPATPLPDPSFVPVTPPVRSPAPAVSGGETAPGRQP